MFLLSDTNHSRWNRCLVVRSVVFELGEKTGILEGKQWPTSNDSRCFLVTLIDCNWFVSGTDSSVIWLLN